MRVSKADFYTLAQDGILHRGSVDKIWEALEDLQVNRPRFDLTNVARYLGGFLIIFALAVWIGLAWEDLGGIGIALISGGLMTVLGWAGIEIHNSGRKILGGILATAAVCTVPLFCYGVQESLGFWPDGSPGNFKNFYRYAQPCWLIMEMSTICASLVMLRVIKAPFLMLPLSFSLFFMSMDTAPYLLTGDFISWTARKWISVYFGTAMLFVATIVQKYQDDSEEADYAHWLFTFGMITFWFGLSSLKSYSEISRLGYGALNLTFIFLGAILQRKVFTIFGAMGFFGTVGYYASHFFTGVIEFTFVTVLMGLFIIMCAEWYHRNHKKIRDYFTYNFKLEIDW